MIEGIIRRTLNNEFFSQEKEQINVSRNVNIPVCWSQKGTEYLKKKEEEEEIQNSKLIYKNN